MKIFLFAFLFFLAVAFNGGCQTTALKTESGSGTDAKPEETIHWMSFTDAVKAGGQKKIFIDVYTKWCGWCKRMDASTYEDPTVVAYINKYFYPVRLDAETRDTIIYKEKIYSFVPQYKANLIALELLSGQMSYPTSVYLDEQFNMLTPAPGYQTPQQLLPQLKFFAENIYKSKTWDDYLKEAH